MQDLINFRTKFKDTLDQVINDRYLSNGHDFINEMQKVHLLIFRTKFTHNCPSCIIDAAKRIKNY